MYGKHQPTYKKQLNLFSKIPKDKDLQTVSFNVHLVQ